MIVVLNLEQQKYVGVVFGNNLIIDVMLSTTF